MEAVKSNAAIATIKLKNDDWDWLSTRDLKRMAMYYFERVSPGVTGLEYLGRTEGYYRFRLFFS